MEVALSLWTTPEMAWDPCSGNTVTFSGCGANNGSAAACNATGSPSPTLFAARSNGFGWQQVRSRGRGGLLEHGNWNITTEVLASKYSNNLPLLVMYSDYMTLRRLID